MGCPYVRPINEDHHFVRRIRFGFKLRTRCRLPLKIDRARDVGEAQTIMQGLPLAKQNLVDH
jgi:hypothetical protein